MQRNAFHIQNRNEQLKKGNQRVACAPQAQTIGGGVGARRGNKVKAINKIYDTKFKMIPYFLRDSSSLLTDLEIKTLPPGTRIFDSSTVPRKFFLIKKGKVKIDDVK